MSIADFGAGAQSALRVLRERAFKQAEFEEKQRQAHEQEAYRRAAMAQEAAQFDASQGLNRQRLALDRDKFGFDREQYAGEAPDREARRGYILTQTRDLEQKPLYAEQARQHDERQFGIRTRLDETQQKEAARHNRAMEGLTSQSRELQNELSALRVQGERDRQDRTRQDRERSETGARQTTETALDLVDRLDKHPGFSMAYGNISSRFAPFSQEATDAGALRDQLTAALTLPNLGALKGPMSDKDILFLKQVSSRLSNPQISEQEARKAVGEARVFLQSKLGGTERPMASHDQGGAPSAPAGWRYVLKPGGGWTAVEDR